MGFRGALLASFRPSILEQKLSDNSHFFNLRCSFTTAVDAIDCTGEFRTFRRQDKQSDGSSLALDFEVCEKLQATSTCRTRIRKGLRCCKVSRNRAAGEAVNR